MMLPDEYQFSASALQDFADCPQRFYLRYILGISWPARITEPIREHEAHLQRGSAFHRLVQQHLNGVPGHAIEPLVQEAGLLDWWENYLGSWVAQAPFNRRYVEHVLSAPYCGRRLVAKYDLILVEDDQRLVIVDWKTSLRRPRLETLLIQAQTRVYRYLLAKAVGFLPGGRIAEPEAIRMMYWFAKFPAEPEVLQYSADQFQSDGETLLKSGEEILGRKEPGDFAPSGKAAACRTCLYSSYCEQGGSPVSFEEMDAGVEPALPGLDFETIEEIAY